MNIKHTFQNTSGFAVTKGKRVFVDEILALHILYPFAADSEHTMTHEDTKLVEVFNENGRRYNGISAFTTDYELHFSGEDENFEDLLDEAPTAEKEEAQVELLDLTKTFPFTGTEDLRVMIRRAARQLQQPTATVVLTGTVTVGKHRPDGKAKKWLEEEVAIEGALVTKVANKWIFLEVAEGPLYAKQLTNGTFNFIV